MDRARFIALSATGSAALAGLARPYLAGARDAPASRSGVESVLKTEFVALPGEKACLVDVESATPWQVKHDEHRVLFCGSAFKTFVLAEYLRQWEQGRLTLDEQLTVDDSVRSPSSPAFLNLSGKVPAQIVLEEMIANSDNTATDIAMKRVGVANVRSFIQGIGLRRTLIPNSTRQFFSYLAGYPYGVDIGWKTIHETLLHGDPPRNARAALNAVETMAFPPVEGVSYYRRALRGEFFAKPETLVRFKRILALPKTIDQAAPPDTVVWLKGGSIDWNGFYALAVAGGMLAGMTPVTFAFIVNWTKSQGEEGAVIGAFAAAVKKILTGVKSAALS